MIDEDGNPVVFGQFMRSLLAHGIDVRHLCQDLEPLAFSILPRWKMVRCFDVQIMPQIRALAYAELREALLAHGWTLEVVAMTHGEKFVPVRIEGAAEVMGGGTFVRQNVVHALVGR